MWKFWKKKLPTTTPVSIIQVKNSVVNHLYLRYKHVIVINSSASGALWDDHCPLDEWCQANDCYWLYDRAWYDQWNNRWESNGIGGGDYFFLATNSDESSVLAKIIWS